MSPAKCHRGHRQRTTAPLVPTANRRRTSIEGGGHDPIVRRPGNGCLDRAARRDSRESLAAGGDPGHRAHRHHVRRPHPGEFGGDGGYRGRHQGDLRWGDRGSGPGRRIRRVGRRGAVPSRDRIPGPRDRSADRGLTMGNANRAHGGNLLRRHGPWRRTSGRRRDPVRGAARRHRRCDPRPGRQRPQLRLLPFAATPRCARDRDRHGGITRQDDEALGRMGRHLRRKSCSSSEWLFRGWPTASSTHRCCGRSGSSGSPSA